ncbi:MAG: hypothetical protein AABW47_04040 [Nanoarchaeota archaeon]
MTEKIEEIKKEIVIERLRQAPQTIRISFGNNGEFMDRDEMIKNINENTEIGKRIVNLQLDYLKAFKKMAFA